RTVLRVGEQYGISVTGQFIDVESTRAIGPVRCISRSSSDWIDGDNSIGLVLASDFADFHAKVQAVWLSNEYVAVTSTSQNIHDHNLIIVRKKICEIFLAGIVRPQDSVWCVSPANGKVNGPVGFGEARS